MMDNSKLDKILNIFREEMAVNNVSGGNIAGTPASDPGNPPVKKKRLYLGKNSRTPWLRNIKQQ